MEDLTRLSYTAYYILWREEEECAASGRWLLHKQTKIKGNNRVKVCSKPGFCKKACILNLLERVRRLKEQRKW